MPVAPVRFLQYVASLGGDNPRPQVYGTDVMSTRQVQQHASSRQLQFGPFRLDTRRRTIDRGGSPLRLGSRARELLITLIERAGETVDKRELMACVWPHCTVHEGTLRVHISALRKALRVHDSSGHYIENVTGHGYRFVAPVKQAGGSAQAPSLPFPLQRLTGRAGSIATLTAWLSKSRLVTVVGPGGVGKTAMVLATADRLRESYPDGVWLVDLANVEDPPSIKHRVAAVIGIPTDCDDLLSAVVEHLKSRRALIVLDSCDRVVDAAAILAEELLGGAASLNVIATGREPLRAKGEWVLRLSPLDLPAAYAALTAEQALEFPAIRLFVERATARLHNFELLDTDVAEVAELCRRLDGLPLAIELAAACVDLFGVRGLAAQMYGRPGLPAGGYRTGVSRHQSLQAMLDWSYEILTPLEQIALRRLAVFAAPFDPAAATAVIADDTIDATDVLDLLASLTAKSLLVTRASGERILYGLFETARAFALEKLACSQDLTETRRRYASLKRACFSALGRIPEC